MCTSTHRSSAEKTPKIGLFWGVYRWTPPDPAWIRGSTDNGTSCLGGTHRHTRLVRRIIAPGYTSIQRIQVWYTGYRYTDSTRITPLSVGPGYSTTDPVHIYTATLARGAQGTRLTYRWTWWTGTVDAHQMARHTQCTDWHRDSHR